MQLGLQGTSFSNRYDSCDEGEWVAIKLIRLDKIREKVQRRLIKNEIKSMHELKNEPNILRLIDIITTKEYLAFVT